MSLVFFVFFFQEKKETKEKNSVNYVDKDISCVKQIKKSLDIVAVALIVTI